MDNSFLEKIISDNSGLNHSKGLDWFSIITKKLESKDYLDESSIVSNAWLVVGDIYYLNGALHHALVAYRNALLEQEDNHLVLYEIASINFDVGNYSESLGYLKKGLRIDPENHSLHDLLGEVNYALTDNDEPLFDINSDKIIMNDLLAKKEYQQVLSRTKGRYDLDSIKARISAFGGLKHKEKYVNEWRNLFEMLENIELEYSDWFYMPREVYEGSSIWNLLLAHNNKIKSGVFESYQSLNSNYNLTESEKREVICKYHLLLKNFRSASFKKIQNQFPLWIELNKLEPN